MSGILAGIAALGSTVISGLNYANSNKTQENTADLNYNYNEMTAGNAAKRQKEYYDYTYQKESPDSQVELYKEAGLNPALMYSGRGGTTIGSSQGGIQAQGVSTSSDKATNAANLAQQLTQNAMMGATLEKTKAETEKTKADTEATKQNTENAWYDTLDKKIEMVIDGEENDAEAVNAIQSLFDKKPGEKVPYRFGNMYEKMKQAGLKQALENIENTDVDSRKKVADAESNKIMANAAMKPYEALQYKDMGSFLLGLLKLALGK